MFDFFNRTTAKNYQQQAEETYNVPTPKVDSIKVTSKHAYTVGLDEENNTVLKLQSDFGSTTMTLNQNGVRQLIRMLEATIPSEVDDWK